ncbi:hypothetical protein ACFVT1_30845 [Streptomyces sp. NPDC057963]|uniref:hypothetical protein n=1 Tax=Streptomyces sp. NPDC057963 TaxID=3346290 RepID=UPI0036F0753C
MEVARSGGAIAAPGGHGAEQPRECKPYPDDRWNEGCTNTWKLREEIVPLGHKGSHGLVSAYIRKKRTSPRPITAQPPAPRLMAGCTLSRPEALPKTGQLRLKAVLANCPEFDTLTATSGPSPGCSPSAGANGSLSGSAPSARTTCQASVASPRASIAAAAL